MVYPSWDVDVGTVNEEYCTGLFRIAVPLRI